MNQYDFNPNQVRRPAERKIFVSRDVISARTKFLRGIFIFFGFFIIWRLAALQIFDYEFYKALAEGQHSILKDLVPERGEIFIRDSASDNLYPIALNEDYYLVYAEPKIIDKLNTEEDEKKRGPSAREITDKIVPIIGMDYGEVLNRLSRANEMYVILKKQVSPEIVESLRALKISGIGFTKESYRSYPEAGVGGHLLGFVGSNADGAKSGKYGLEGYFDAELKGTKGSLKSEKNPLGGWIVFGGHEVDPAVNGEDLILTIDRSIQFTACEKLKNAVKSHGADGGSVIIMNPQTGAILAICSAPDFNPNEYGKVESIDVFNNPAISHMYEPGSIMKPFTMAAALDTGEVNPETTYNDTGSAKFTDYTIQNSDEKSYGIQTMTQVLEKSLNTGMVFVAGKLGNKTLRKYLEDFGFNAKTGIELSSEVAGNISSLMKKGDIYAATASFGQGISVTPIELVTAFGAIANGGKLMKPYIIDEIKKGNGFAQKTEPKEVRQVISERAARLLGGMLVSVVDNGHGKRAGVAGYSVAGKTGTAQVPKKNDGGYETDVTIGSFLGYAPVDNPKFVMLVKIDKPRDVQWAESSAAPLFGEIAEFLLHYYKVPPDR
jgi:cell division protein FtsI/penicillin-binding protein 2